MAYIYSVCKAALLLLLFWSSAEVRVSWSFSIQTSFRFCSVGNFSIRWLFFLIIHNNVHTFEVSAIFLKASYAYQSCINLIKIKIYYFNLYFIPVMTKLNISASSLHSLVSHHDPSEVVLKKRWKQLCCATYALWKLILFLI